MGNNCLTLELRKVDMCRAKKFEQIDEHGVLFDVVDFRFYGDGTVISARLTDKQMGQLMEQVSEIGLRQREVEDLLKQLDGLREENGKLKAKLHRVATRDCIKEQEG